MLLQRLAPKVTQVDSPQLSEFCHNHIDRGDVVVTSTADRQVAFQRPGVEITADEVRGPHSDGADGDQWTVSVGQTLESVRELWGFLIGDRGIWSGPPAIGPHSRVDRSFNFWSAC